MKNLDKALSRPEKSQKKSVPFSGPTASDSARLKKIWLQKKIELKLTQVTVAKTLGIKQSTLSQYLNGVIPLNTNMVLNLSEILKVEPGAISKSLFRYSRVDKNKSYMVPVLFSISGLLQGAKEMIPFTKATKRKTNDFGKDSDQSMWAVYIDEELRSPLLRQGSYLILVSNAVCEAGDTVWLVYTDARKPAAYTYIGAAQKSHDIVCLLTGKKHTVIEDDIHSCSKVISVQF